jgi:hypothetical protein
MAFLRDNQVLSLTMRRFGLTHRARAAGVALSCVWAFTLLGGATCGTGGGDAPKPKPLTEVAATADAPKPAVPGPSDADLLAAVQASKNIDLTPLDDQQRATFAKVLKSEPCDCACGDTLGACVSKPNACLRARFKAQYALIGIAEGVDANGVGDVLRNDFSKTYCGPELTIETRDAPALGPATAPVQIVIFSDFQCPHCGSVAPEVHRVHKFYGDKVRIVFKHYPLSSIHPHAKKASVAAVAAGRQGKFWEMHDKLFQNQAEMSELKFIEHAKAIGLNEEQFKKDMLDPGVVAQVEADRAEGQKLQVPGTPAVYMNGRAYDLPRDAEFMRLRIDDILTPQPCCGEQGEKK